MGIREQVIEHIRGLFPGYGIRTASGLSESVSNTHVDAYKRVAKACATYDSIADELSRGMAQATIKGLQKPRCSYCETPGNGDRSCTQCGAPQVIGG